MKMTNFTDYSGVSHIPLKFRAHCTRGAHPAPAAHVCKLETGFWSLCGHTKSVWILFLRMKTIKQEKHSSWQDSMNCSDKTFPNLWGACDPFTANLCSAVNFPRCLHKFRTFPFLLREMKCLVHDIYKGIYFLMH